MDTPFSDSHSSYLTYAQQERIKTEEKSKMSTETFQALSWMHRCKWEHINYWNWRRNFEKAKSIHIQMNLLSFGFKVESIKFLPPFFVLFIPLRCQSPLFTDEVLFDEFKPKNKEYFVAFFLCLLRNKSKRVPLINKHISRNDWRREKNRRAQHTESGQNYLLFSRREKKLFWQFWMKFAAIVFFSIFIFNLFRFRVDCIIKTMCHVNIEPIR